MPTVSYLHVSRQDFVPRSIYDRQGSNIEKGSHTQGVTYSQKDIDLYPWAGDVGTGCGTPRWLVLFITGAAFSRRSSAGRCRRTIYHHTIRHVHVGLSPFASLSFWRIPGGQWRGHSHLDSSRRRAYANTGLLRWQRLPRAHHRTCHSDSWIYSFSFTLRAYASRNSLRGRRYFGSL